MNQPSFATGFDVLLAEHAPLLRGRHVGMLVHPASLTVRGRWTPEVLHDHGVADLVALFGPEHGLYGHGGAGERVASSLHPRWEVPVHSLYGNQRKPSPDLLSGIDALIIDLQDLAVRCYTYVATLQLVLEAAHEAGLQVIVTDRPVPFPGLLDGPMPEEGFESFVCPVHVPLVYGMTPAETARWIVERDHLQVDLHAIPMRGYTRDPVRRSEWMPWVPPSTGIRSWETAWCYPATVFTEALPALDCDRTGLLPFQVFGATWMQGESVAPALNEQAWPGVEFVPHDYVASDGTLLQGVRLIVSDANRFHPVTVGFAILRTVQDHYGTSRLWDAEGTRPEFFDTLCGSRVPREALLEGVPIPELRRVWESTWTAFVSERRDCLLYE